MSSKLSMRSDLVITGSVSTSVDRHIVEIDPRQPLSMPGRSGGRHAEQDPKGTALLGRELRGDHEMSLEMLPEEAVRHCDVAQPKILILCHRCRLTSGSRFGGSHHRDRGFPDAVAHAVRFQSTPR